METVYRYTLALWLCFYASSFAGTICTSGNDSVSKSNFHYIDSARAMTESTYWKCIDSLRLNGTTDFITLRLAYTATKNYSSLSDDSPVFETIDTLFLRNQFGPALALADSFLGEFPLSLKMHNIASVLCDRLNDTDQADYHQIWVNNLTRSILMTGDGLTPETAYIVLTVSEEYWLLRILGLKSNQQKLIESNGYSFDALECIDRKTQKKRTVYFNIALIMDSYSRLLNKKKAEPLVFRLA